MEDEMSTTTTNRMRRGRRWIAGVSAVLILATGLAAVTASPATAARKCDPDGDCGPVPTDPPDDFHGPPGAGNVAITNRTSSSLSFTLYLGSNTTKYALQRLEGTTWVTGPTVQASGAALESESGLPPDTRRCYRVKTMNAYGASTIGASTCAFTKDGRGLLLWRVRLQIQTGDVADAGTDDDISASIAGPIGGSTGGTTWLDHSIDDFQRGSIHTYDLPGLKGIGELGDIESIALNHQGDDDWCVKAVTLYVNDAAAFSTGFDSACTWTGSDTATTLLSVTHDAMRAYPLWTGFHLVLPPIVSQPDGSKVLTFKLPREEIEERVEAMVGHSITGTDAYWGHLYGRAVEESPNANGSAHVDLDLAADAFTSDPDVDVDFDLVPSTVKQANGEWKLKVAVANLVPNVDLAWWQDLLDAVVTCGTVSHIVTLGGNPFCLQHLAIDGEKEIAAMVAGAGLKAGIGTAPSNLTAAFDATGALVIAITFGPPPPPPPPQPPCCITWDPGPGGGVLVPVP
jgi:PLAT/LH2 domain